MRASVIGSIVDSPRPMIGSADQSGAGWCLTLLALCSKPYHEITRDACELVRRRLSELYTLSMSALVNARLTSNQAP